MKREIRKLAMTMDVRPFRRACLTNLINLSLFKTQQQVDDSLSPGPRTTHTQITSIHTHFSHPTPENFTKKGNTRKPATGIIAFHICGISNKKDGCNNVM